MSATSQQNALSYDLTENADCNQEVTLLIFLRMVSHYVSFLTDISSYEPARQLTSECKVVYCLALGKKSGANVQHCIFGTKPAQFSNSRILLVDHCALCHSNTMPCSINTMECQLRIAHSRCLTSHRAILPPWLDYISCLATE